MPRGGVLTLRAFNRDVSASEARGEEITPGRYVALEIADTGTGMPDDVASRVFEPFFTTKGAGLGTGLGLATAYGVVKQAGGTIELRTKQGQGTAFTVLLPATDEPDGDAEGARPRGGAGGETILLVEDERLVRNLTRRILADAGYGVLEAGSGAEALELSASHSGPIHLLLTDVIMPRMSGKQVMERLSAQRPGLRVLYMSGYFDDAIGTDILRHFIAKPFQREALLERVRAALARPAP
jgi:CheY-like chemotaxis protein